MKFEKLTVSYAVRMSHDYNAVEGQASLTVGLEEGDKPKTIYREVYDNLKAMVNKEVAETLEVVVQEVAVARKGGIQ